MPKTGFTKDWMKEIGETIVNPDFGTAVNPDNSVSTASYETREAQDLAREDVNFLAGLAIPTIFEYMFPPVILAIWGLLLKHAGDLQRSFPKIALGIPRGHAKTTLIKLYVLYCILFTRKKFILVICGTAQKAENFVSDVISMLNEPNITSLFGRWDMGVVKNTSFLKVFGFRGRNIILAAIGAEGDIRGLNLGNDRPDIMIFDDIQSKECSEYPLQSGILERWFIATALKAGSPRGCLFIFCGNMYPGPNALLKKLKKDPNWIKFISGAILANGKALWEEHRSLQSLIEELNGDIALGHPEIFFSEVMNDTEVGINNKIDLSLLRDWKWGPDEIAQGRFIVIDPGGNKANSDATSIGYVEVFDGVPGLREVEEGIMSPGTTIRKALLMALVHNCACIACEATAYQSSLLYWFNVVAEELGIVGLQFVEIHNNHVSKNSAIMSNLRGLTAGETIIHPDVRSALTHQIVNFNPLKRENVDGLLDLLGFIHPVMHNYEHLILTPETHLITGAQSEGVTEDLHMF
jgi:hypothetical protein